MKTLFMGDWQVYAKPNAFESGTDVLDNSLRALAEVFQIAHDNECGVIYCTGDVFEHQTPSPYVTNKVIQAFKELHFTYPHMLFRTITGNHDFAAGTPCGDEEKPNRTILNVVEKASYNFRVVDYAHWTANDHTVACIPFCRNENDFLAYVDGLVDSWENKDTILLMHQDTAQEIPNSQIDERELAKKFKYVVNGHIHRRKQTGNFITIGSLTQQKGGDMTEVSKGVYIFDSTDGSMTFHEVTGYPVFREYYQGDEIKPEHQGDYIVRREKPVEVKKSLRKLDDTTEKGREHIGKTFLAERIADVPQELEAELATLTARVQGFIARERKTVKYVSLKVKGYRSWLDGEYDLNPTKLQYIQAATGSGKSSIFEALFWAEFGQLLKAKALQEDVIPEKWLQDLGDFQGTMAQVVKEVNGVLFTVTRCIAYKGDVFGQRGADGFYLHYQNADGQWLPCDATYFDLNAEDFKDKTKKTRFWAEFCGVDSEMFLNSVIFTPEKCNLIQSSDADKRALLEPLLGVAWVDRLKDLAKVERQQEESLVLTAKTQLTITQERIAMAENAIVEIGLREVEFDKKKQEQVEGLRGKINANYDLQPQFKGYVEEAKKVVADTEAQVDNTITDKLAQLQTELDGKQKKVFAFAEDIAVLNAKWAAIQPEKSEAAKRIETDIEACKREAIEKQGEARRVELEIEGKRRRADALQPVATPRHLELTVESEGLKKRVEDAEAALGKSNSGKETLTATIDTKQATLASLQTDLEHKSGDCPVCKQKLPKGHDILKDLEQHKANVALLVTEVRKLDDDLVQWHHEHGLLMDDANEVNRLWGKVLEAIEAERVVEVAQLNTDKLAIDGEINTLKSDLDCIRLWFSTHDNTLTLLTQDLATEMRACEQVAQSKILALQGQVSDLEGERDEFKADEIEPVILRMNALRASLNAQSEIARQLDAAKKELGVAEADLADLLKTIEGQNAEVQKVLATRFDPNEYGKDRQDAQIAKQGEILATQQLDIQRREARIANLKQIETQVCGAKGIKAMLIQQKLDRINTHATEYANALGTSIRFYLDEGNNYRCSMMIQGHERDARKASNGQLALGNLIFVGAIKDLLSETVDIPMQMLDEPFGALDPESIFSISQLLSLQAKKRAMHVITHATELDMTNADVLRIEGGEKFPSRFVN